MFISFHQTEKNYTCIYVYKTTPYKYVYMCVWSHRIDLFHDNVSPLYCCLPLCYYLRVHIKYDDYCINRDRQFFLQNNHEHSTEWPSRVVDVGEHSGVWPCYYPPAYQRRHGILRRLSSIRFHHCETTNGQMSSYNSRVPLTRSRTALRAFICSIHCHQAIWYKINTSCCFILRHKLLNRLRYFHASVNNFSILGTPCTIQSMDQIDILMDECLNMTLEDMSSRAHPTLEWVSVTMTNVALCVYHTQVPLIKCPGDGNDDNGHGVILNNQSVILILRESDNLCLSGCLTLSQILYLSVIAMCDRAR